MFQSEYKHQLHGKDGKQYILSTHLDGINGCASFMHEVLNGKDLYYKTQIKTNGRQQTTISPLGKHLDRLHQYVALFRPHYSFHPALTFFLEEYRKHEIKDYFKYKATDVFEDGRVMSDIFDDFVMVMREHAYTAKLKKKISDWESKTKKNKKRTLEFEAELFRRHARVVVIRLDLDYRKATFSAEEIDQFMNEAAWEKLQAMNTFWDGADLSAVTPIEGRIAFEEVQSDRQHLFANMKGKPSLFEHMVGYIWRIEFSPKAGYHLHTALFFNGAEVKNHKWLAQQIGEYWEDNITAGRGRFHNCNMAWDEHSPHYGLGIIDHYDHVKRANLLTKVLAYLCKDQQRVQVLPYAGCNLFGSGFAHRDQSKGRGRPRTKGENVFDQPGVLPV